MATVSDINAHTSFGSIYNEFSGDGQDIITKLKATLADSIGKINAQTYLLAADIAEAETAYLSPLISGPDQLLNTAILGLLTSEEYGPSSTAKDALLARMSHRESQLYLSELASLTPLFTAGGFSAPAGAAAAATLRLQSEQLDKLNSAHRDSEIVGIAANLTGKTQVYATALGIEEQNVARFISDMNRFARVLETRLEEFKLQVQAQVSNAVAAIQALNVNIGLSVSGTASVGGTESSSETTDKSATEIRHTETVSNDLNHATQTSSSVHNNIVSSDYTNNSTYISNT